MNRQRSPRPAVAEVMMGTAWLWARRSTCPRMHTGSVVATPQGQVLTTGYNGAPRGTPHCEEVGCDVYRDNCVRSVHGEINALMQAARLGVALEGAVLYCTHRPCIRCAMAIVQAGISRVVYQEPYPGDDPTTVGVLFVRTQVVYQEYVGGGDVIPRVP